MNRKIEITNMALAIREITGRDIYECEREAKVLIAMGFHDTNRVSGQIFANIDSTPAGFGFDKNTELVRVEDSVYIGDPAWICYELGGEHCVREGTVEEILVDREGLKRIRIKADDLNLVFMRDSSLFSLNAVAFTEESAEKWLGGKQ